MLWRPFSKARGQATKTPLVIDIRKITHKILVIFLIAGEMDSHFCL